MKAGRNNALQAEEQKQNAGIKNSRKKRRTP